MNTLKILLVDLVSWVQAINGYRQVTPALAANMGWPASKQALFLAVYSVRTLQGVSPLPEVSKYRPVKF